MLSLKIVLPKAIYVIGLFGSVCWHICTPIMKSRRGKVTIQLPVVIAFSGQNGWWKCKIY